MRGIHKSKRVSWASDVNLCQVRLFLSEDAPFQVSLGTQDHLQAKTSWSTSHPAGTGSDDALPPGFEAPQDSYQCQIQLSEIPLIQWRCPKRIVLNHAWRVVAGEESNETEAQSRREMRTLEAVYPRESSIPQNPVYSAESEDFHRSDLQIPSIPITPIEDEDMPSDGPSSSYGAPMISQPPPLAPGISGPSNGQPSQSMAHGIEPDTAAAASAALTAIMKSNEHESSIDQELLIQILSNPKMIEKLVNEYGTNAMQRTPGTVTGPVALSTPVTGPASSSGPFYPRFSQPSFSPAPSQPTVVTTAPPPLPPPTNAPPHPSHNRDMNYYKNLIHQHGRERQDFTRPEPPNSNNLHNGPRPRESKGKIMKPCIYFNSSRGCRNGANCAYQHDSSIQPRGSSGMGEGQNPKRMKLDREITGT